MKILAAVSTFYGIDSMYTISCLFSILCILCFCIVLCIVSFVYSRLFPIFVHDHCHEMEAQLQSINIIYHIILCSWYRAS